MQIDSVGHCGNYVAEAVSGSRSRRQGARPRPHGVVRGPRGSAPVARSRASAPAGRSRSPSRDALTAGGSRRPAADRPASSPNTGRPAPWRGDSRLSIPREPRGLHRRGARGRTAGRPRGDAPLVHRGEARRLPPEAARRIAEALGRDAGHVSFAGRKDAKAVTRQTMCIEHVTPDALLAVELERIRIKDPVRCRTSSGSVSSGGIGSICASPGSMGPRRATVWRSGSRSSRAAAFRTPTESSASVLRATAGAWGTRS